MSMRNTAGDCIYQMILNDHVEQTKQGINGALSPFEIQMGECYLKLLQKNRIDFSILLVKRRATKSRIRRKIPSYPRQESKLGSY